MRTTSARPVRIVTLRVPVQLRTVPDGSVFSNTRTSSTKTRNQTGRLIEISTVTVPAMPVAVGKTPTPGVGPPATAVAPGVPVSAGDRVAPGAVVGVIGGVVAPGTLVGGAAWVGTG